MLFKVRVVRSHVVVIEPLLEVGRRHEVHETEGDQAVPIMQGS
jgi:hypothetical protein